MTLYLDRHPLARASLVVIGYVAGGLGGLQLASIAGAVSLIWPPTGIALAALVLGGRRMAAPVWVGALIVNLLIGGSPLTAALIACGNTLEALVAAELLARAGFRGSFESRREVRDFALIAGLLAPLCAALGGATSLLVTGTIEAKGWLPTAALWWAGDATGALVVGPLVLTWLRPARSVPLRRWVGTLLVTIAASSLAFAAPRMGVELRSALLVVPISSVVWAALRLGPRGAATACALLCLVAVVGTALTGGPLAGLEGSLAPVPLWLFITAAAMLSLLLTALNAERGSAEVATRVSNERFANAFEHAPIGMAMVTDDGLVLDANPRIARMLISDPERLRGQPISTWLAEPLEGVVRAALAVRAEDPPSLVQVTDEAGERREWNVRVSRIPLSERKRAFLLQAEDVTESRVNAAALEVLNDQLVHAQRMDSVGNLAGGIAHDFNNLLQAIGANLELAQHPSCSQATRAKVLDNASDAVRRAAALTSRLLAFSHRSPVQRVPVDLNQTLQRAREMLVRLLPENVSLDVSVGTQPAMALVDETQLDQVLMNLCVNARDAMPQGGRIDLRIEVDDQWIVLSSTDQGTGVPPELRQRIFEPFFTTKARGQGTGFGLSVVFGIVRAHDGEIHVEDGPEGGARFVVRLPRTAERPVAMARVDSTDSAAPLTVLLAEDDPAVRQVLTEMLRADGHEVLAAVDGAQALERYQADGERVDLLLFDVRMPRMTGPAAMRQILGQRRGLPAILMSGYSGDALTGNDTDLADVELLAKPFEQADLTQALHRATRAKANSLVGTRSSPAA
ncbi:MAG: MASE1 domain-containing protein [Sandaracinaceae bacterium]|nr:MASE1 domain-containing protein [Sandaracinaceae bacterium]MBK7777614.1 MASE1 domain-containing protein [Sandaracinaceae bacterium]MBK8590193.1 MASE1 domain-containing protein [Sandaracinaceae bacterium]MBP7680698.1 MASE1 domain-containing protein [Deltaproteobacteria bacterium]